MMIVIKPHTVFALDVNSSDIRFSFSLVFIINLLFVNMLVLYWIQLPHVSCFLTIVLDMIVQRLRWLTFFLLSKFYFADYTSLHSLSWDLLRAASRL